MTDVDQRDRVALAAIDATAGSGIVGVARFIVWAVHVTVDLPEPAAALDSHAAYIYAA